MSVCSHTWDDMGLSLHNLNLMLRLRTFLLHHFGKNAYSHDLAYLGLHIHIVLITSVHAISHKGLASHDTEDE